VTDNALNIAELKVNNRRRILESLRYNSLSRAELSREIGLTKSSITALTNEMIAEGILYEAGQAPKSNKAGRTGTLLDISNNYGYVIGINIHRKKISVAGADVKGNPFFEFCQETASFNSSEAAFEYITENIDLYIEKNNLSREKLLCIGVASPGPIDYEKGKILEPPNFSVFNNFPITEKLSNKYNCPVYLENNAVALALYECHSLKEHYGRSLFVVISDGIGGALLQDGEVYRGSHGVAGELGHISVNFEGEKCACGNRGCLEQYATLASLKKRFGFDSYEQLVDTAINGDEKSIEVLDYLVNVLGTAFVAAVNLFDLEKIILCGEYAYKSDFLTKRLENYIEQHSIICKSHKVCVVKSVQDLSATACAAAIPALNSFFKYNIF